MSQSSLQYDHTVCDHMVKQHEHSLPFSQFYHTHTPKHKLY